MGRVIRHEVVALQCELRTCANSSALTAGPVSVHASVADCDFRRQLNEGWVLVATPQLRSYCPDHRARAWSCTCRTNPARRHLCTVHSSAAAALLMAALEPDWARLEAA